METNHMMSNNTITLDVDIELMKKMSFIGTIHKIFGVLAVIGGALTCLGIVTAIFGVPYLIAGIKLFKSGSSFSYATYSNDGKFLKDALFNLASFWLFNIIAIVATIVLYIIFLAVMLFFLSSNYDF